jgi:hypothetical protein
MSTESVIRGISQVLANTFDGAREDDGYGDYKHFGLRRDDGDPILNSRTMDGFRCKFGGDKLMINYQADIKIEEVKDKKFESKLEDMFEKIVTYLKKEYKKITGEALSLTVVGDMNSLVQTTSNVRTFVMANRTYKIGKIDALAITPEGKVDRVDKKIRDFLSLAAKERRADNDSRKKDRGDK